MDDEVQFDKIIPRDEEEKKLLEGLQLQRRAVRAAGHQDMTSAIWRGYRFYKDASDEQFRESMAWVEEQEAQQEF